MSDAFAQGRTITGRVTEAATGRPLPGAQVYLPVEGTDRAAAGALTSQTGTFSLTVPETGDVTLAVRMLGYQRTEARVPAGQSSVEIALQTDVLQLEELVVTGQGTGIQRRNLANAVSSVSEEQLNRTPAASIETQLAGKVPGADIQSNSGAPGGGNQINLRGVSSIIGNSTPLYVIDGVIVSDRTLGSGSNALTEAGSGISNSQDQATNRIADLNPADIERIEVLKGAAAAAIYGSKANNGVIVISTKRGAVGEPRYNLTQRFGGSQLSNKLGTRAFTDVETAVSAFGDRAAEYFVDGVAPSYDLEEELAGGVAPAYETQLSVSGGTEDTRYYVSGLVRDEEGVVQGTYYDKYSLKVNLDQTLSERLTLELRTNALRTRTGRGFTGNDNTSTTYYMTVTGTPSFVDLRQNDDGSFPDNPFQVSNPLETAALADNDEEINRFIGGATLQFDALQRGAHSLRFIGTAGADYISGRNVIYAPETLQFEPLDGYPGTSVLSNASSTQFNTNLTAVHTFAPEGGAFTATTSAGTRFEQRDLDIARVHTRNLFAGQQNVNQGVDRIPDQNRELARDWSVFVQEEFLLGERLLLTAGLNADRSSNNSDTDKWFTYPKLAASYRFSPNIAWIDDLKLRAAYGQAGNLPLYGQKFNTLDPGSLGGVQTLLLDGTTVAADLRPERQVEYEGGVDLYLMGGRGSLEVTAYRREIRDLLLNRDLPNSTGYTNALFNSDGLLSTRGVEAAITAVPVQTRGFEWTSRIAFSHDKSVVDSLPVPPFNVSGAGFGTSLGAVRLEQGRSPTAIFGRDTTTFVDDPRCLEALGVEPGSGQCAAGTRIVTQIGDANPDFRMGFVNDFRFGDFSLTSTLDWQQGGDAINLTGYLLDANRNTADFDDPCPYAECQPGQTLGEYRLSVYPGRTTTVWVEDASFVKLRELTLTYNVPASLLGQRMFGVDAMQLSLSGRNLLTFTDYSGLDPEVNNFGSQAIRGNVDVAPYPPSRSLWLGVNVSF